MPSPSSRRARTERIGEQAPIRPEEIEKLYGNAPVGLCVVDRDLRYVRANAAYARSVGGSAEELIGKSMREGVPAERRPGAIAMAMRVIETGEAVLDREVRGPAPDDPSTERIWLVNAHPLKRDGEVIGAMASLQDITSVRRAEEAAGERLRELESIYRNAPVGLSFVDRNLRYLRVNQVIADMNGVSIEEMLGRTYRDLSPERADAAEPFFRSLMDSGASIRNLETRAIPPADPGVEHVYLLSLAPVRDSEDRMVGTLAAVQDITELRRAEATAKRRLEELEILYTHTPVGLCYMDAELRVVHTNPLFAQLSEVPLEKQVGAAVPDLLPKALADQIVPQLRYVARTAASSVGLEVRGLVPGPGSHEHTWIVHTHPARSEGGRVTGIITVLQDVTPLAERQREAEAVRDRLAEAQHVVQVGSWEWDLLEDVVWWSRELYEIFGERLTYAPSYTGFFERVHADDRDKVREQIERTLEDEQLCWVTFRILRPDGTQRVLFTAARLERAPNGQPARLIGTCQDVTKFSPADARSR